MNNRRLRMNNRRLPTEILLAVGECLDCASVPACLRVCRQWYSVLHPFVWITITRQQCSHPTFPIQPSARLAAPFDTKEEEINAIKCISCLRMTRSFEWNSLARQSRPQGHHTREYPDCTPAQLLAKAPFPNPPLHRWMPNLTRFSLIDFSDLSDDFLVSILDSVHFPSLRSLFLHLAYRPTKLPIERLFPLFSQLEELELVGCWYGFSTPRMGAGHGHGEPTLWSLKTLMADWMLESFLKKSPALEHLVIHDPKLFPGPSRHHLRPWYVQRLGQLSQLKTITLRSGAMNSRLENSVFRIRNGFMGRAALWDRMSSPSGIVSGKGWTLEGVVDYLFECKS